MNARHCQNTTSVVSPAKLNLFLNILNRRPDGYHNIQTLFERISLLDSIHLTEINSDEVIVSSDCPDIPCDHRNIAYQAADLIRRSQGIKKGVKIDIEKKIPIGAGLGGGSSNAAAVLLGLNRLFKLRLNKKTLMAYGNRLGSDVAFFILQKNFAIGTARGGDLKAVTVPKNLRLWHLLFVPPLKLMSKDIYDLLDKEEKTEKSLKLTYSLASGVYTKGPPLVSILSETNVLTRKTYDVNILLSYLKKGNVSALNRNIFNRLSATVMKSYRLVSELKSDLLKYGLKNVYMSGSGPTLFTIFKTEEQTQRAFQEVRNRLSNRCSIFLVSTF